MVMAGNAPNAETAGRVLPPLTLQPLQEGVCQVLDAGQLHLGNLKWVAGVWKFKAIGYGAQGELIPGGGPLTEWHNTRFMQLDVAEVNAVFCPA
jgi:hypothetical protein